jgi:uncharacterized protein with GYD domain
MTRYLIEETGTPQGVSGLLQTPEDRTEAIRPIFEAVGGSLEQFYFSLAENTAFLIVDAPDQASLDAVMLAIFAGGALASYRVTPIISASEAVDLFKRAASVAYRPPGR